MQLLVSRNDRLHLKKISIHADILNERHTNGTLGSALPMSLFVETDYLLFLRSVLCDYTKENWVPWSAVYISSQRPQYLVRLVQTKFTLQFLPVLGLKDIETLRVRLAERNHDLRSVFGFGMRRNPLAGFDLKTIASL